MADHTFTPTRREYSRNPKTGRALMTWDAGCSCGWTRYTNEGKRHAETLWRTHVATSEELARTGEPRPGRA